MQESAEVMVPSLEFQSRREGPNDEEQGGAIEQTRCEGTPRRQVRNLLQTLAPRPHVHYPARDEPQRRSLSSQP